MYELAFNKLWGMLLQGVDIDVVMFKNLDKMANERLGFYNDFVNQVVFFKSEIDDSYKSIKENELPYYIYLKLFSVLKMFESLYNGTAQYIDFYKRRLSKEEIEKAHTLIVKYDIIDVIKYNIICENTAERQGFIYE
jgi:hypothetical protein